MGVIRRKEIGLADGTVSVSFGSPERVDFHLENWAAWKRSGQHEGAYGSVAVGLSCGGVSQDFDTMAEASDRRCASIVDTIIGDLPTAQSSAIYHAYLASVFAFPRGNFQAALDASRIAVGKGLAKRGIW